MGTNNDLRQEQKDPKDAVIYALAELIQHASEGKLSSNELTLVKHITWMIQQKRYDLGTTLVSDKELESLFDFRRVMELSRTYAYWRDKGRIKNQYPDHRDLPFSKTQILETFALSDVITKGTDMLWTVIGDLGFSVRQTACLIDRLNLLHTTSDLLGIEPEESRAPVPLDPALNEPSVNLLSLSPVVTDESGFWMHNKPMEQWGTQFCHAPSRLVLNALVTWRWRHGSFPVDNFRHVGPEHSKTGRDGGHVMIEVLEEEILITTRRNYDGSPFSFCVMRKPA